MRRLRSIALTVDELDPGSYCWSLLEAPADSVAFSVLCTSTLSYPSYDAALASGVEALRSTCADLGAGPRAGAEADSDSHPNDSGWTPL
ncbi:MAG: hypothetical protein EOO22_26570 [Comamonadaceae bacterium]|nr:MAG: hypothetical protein EOO22_26570 [Comamonadaceae bacterium]